MLGRTVAQAVSVHHVRVARRDSAGQCTCHGRSMTQAVNVQHNRAML
jgi:hypothetical protein